MLTALADATAELTIITRVLGGMWHFGLYEEVDADLGDHVLQLIANRQG